MLEMAATTAILSIFAHRTGQVSIRSAPWAGWPRQGITSTCRHLSLELERTGPDLSQEGGAHTDEWHYAHFYNPR